MKKNKQHYCVILAGGKSSKLWPIHREDRPKQFQDIMKKGRTLIQEVFQNIASLFFVENIFLITEAKYQKLVFQQLPDLLKSNLLLEPLAMNTSSSIAYASFKLYILNKEALVFTIPSDQSISQENDFNESLRLAFKSASIYKDSLITLGIKPTYAETNYGYIQFLSEDLKNNEKNKKTQLKKVKTFVEKPSVEMADNFLKSGDFLLNSGMFVWKIESILNAFKEHSSETYDFFYKGISKLYTSEEENFIKSIFPALKKISIDYAILEKSSNVYVVSSQFSLIDMSSWSTIYKELQKNKAKNAILGNQVVTYEANRNLIYSNNKKKVIIAQSINDFIIIDTKDALLICKQSDEKKIKQCLKDLKINGQEEFL